MSDAVLNQILSQLQALQASQQSLQAKVYRTADGSASERISLNVVYRSTILQATAMLPALRALCLAFREQILRR